MKRKKAWLFCLFLFLIISLVNIQDALAGRLRGRVDLTKAYAHYIMGVLYDNNGQIHKAQEEYKKVIEADPGSLSGHMRLCVNYVKLGLFRKAIQQIAAAMKSYPLAAPLEKENLGFINFKMAVLYTRLDNFRAAEYSLRKAITQFERGLANQEAYAAHFYLATLYEKQNMRRAAKYRLRRALQLNPDDHEALNYLGYMYAEDGENLDQAVLMIKKALESEPDNGAYLDSLGWAYFKKGRLKEALNYLKKAYEAMPDPVIGGHLKEVKEKTGK